MPRSGGADGVVQAVVRALVDGRTGARAALDELQGLARQGIGPASSAPWRRRRRPRPGAPRATRRSAGGSAAGRRRPPTRTSHRRGAAAVRRGAAASGMTGQVTRGGTSSFYGRRRHPRGLVFSRADHGARRFPRGPRSPPRPPRRRRSGGGDRCPRDGCSRAGRLSPREAHSSSSGLATAISSRRSSAHQDVGISVSRDRRRATRARSAAWASPSISTSRSAIMLRSKALTRLAGRQTTSARRLNRAARAREVDGAAAPDTGSVSSRGAG